MENATKALLIAAAVLVAILIISLGLVVYNRASETVSSVDMSGQEIQAFNEKFLKYNGKNKRGTEVNALLKTAVNNNLSENTNGNDSKIVEVSGKAAVTKDTKIVTTVDSSKLYDVQVQQDGPGGLVKTITINEAGKSTSTETKNP